MWVQIKMVRRKEKYEYNSLNICIVIMDTGDHIYESVQFHCSPKEILPVNHH